MLIDERRLRAELADAQHWLNRTPGSRIYLEGVARCLHWLKDPAAEEMFRKLVAQYRPLAEFSGDPRALMILANYHRLAGEEDQARHYFVQARDLLQPGVKNLDSVRIGRLVECHFLLGEYEEVLKLADLLRKMRKKGLLAYTIARLARARLIGDKTEAAAAAEEVAAAIRKDRAKIRETAPGLTLWDWYEIAAKDAGIL